MPKQNWVNVTVLVDQSHQENPAGIENDLKAKGFVLKETLGAIGALSGSVPVNSLAALSTVPGVSAVEEERSDYHAEH